MKVPADHRPFVMTVDVEDWYSSSIDLFAEATAAGDHRRPPDESVVRNTLHCLDLFHQTSCRATFFILTSVAEAYPDLIREIERQGHEIGVHGYQRLPAHVTLRAAAAANPACDAHWRELGLLSSSLRTGPNGYRGQTALDQS